jgi:lipopolysaccharide/colanic/teichoic acid biosynthesis glycosyltransferase
VPAPAGPEPTPPTSTSSDEFAVDHAPAGLAVKRAIDIAGALLGLVLLSPLFLAVALVIRVVDGSPVLFRQPRVGRLGRHFTILKFRTMTRDADARRDQVRAHNEVSGNAAFKMTDDPRVTTLGRWLRRTSLDELPNLWNVLRGEMSLVGPRPLPVRDFVQLEDWHRKRYLVMPGMTGLWQVSGRSELDFDELVRLDFLYLERWSVFLDLTILLKTIPAVVRARGAW